MFAVPVVAKPDATFGEALEHPHQKPAWSPVSS